jgi:ribonuclease P protein component
MLPARLKVKTQEFKFLSRGAVYHSDHFTLKVGRVSGQRDPKCSVVVSKKAVNQSARRNLLKRRGYAVFKDVFSLLEVGKSYVVYAKKEAATLSFREMKHEITTLFKKYLKHA